MSQSCSTLLILALSLQSLIFTLMSASDVRDRNQSLYASARQLIPKNSVIPAPDDPQAFAFYAQLVCLQPAAIFPPDALFSNINADSIMYIV